MINKLSHEFSYNMEIIAFESMWLPIEVANTDLRNPPVPLYFFK